MIKRLFSKILALTIILSINFMGTTSASLSDAEKSYENTFAAGSVDLSLKDRGGALLASPLFGISVMKPGDSETKIVKVTKEGTLDFQYSVRVLKTGGDDNLCNALKIEARLDGVSRYSGSLTSLNLNPAATISGGEDSWDFTVRLESADTGLQSQTCSFDLIIKGWQIGSDGNWGLTDTESLTNSVSTTTWDTPGSVVINEIMWMGSTASSADEWIELRNTTNNPIDLTNWKIENAGESNNSITLTGLIPANGYFLLSNYPTNDSAISDSIAADQTTTDLSLLDTGEQLTLKSAIGVIIDQTPSGAWAAGIKTAEKKSMERNDDPSTGWHTCIDNACNDTTYWDSEGSNYGTPKASNLSENDSSAVESTPLSSPTLPPTVSQAETATLSPTAEDLKGFEATPIPTPYQTESSPTPEGVILSAPMPTASPTETPSPTPEEKADPSPTPDL